MLTRKGAQVKFLLNSLFSDIENVFRFTKLTVFLKINFDMILSLFYSFFLCFSSGAEAKEGLHPIHISVTEINYNEKSKSLQITTRIFVDEMELGVRTQRKEPELDVLDPKNGVSTKQLINNYLTAHFKIKI